MSESKAITDVEEQESVRKIGRRMPIAEAEEWAKRYQEKYPEETFGFLYGRDIINSMEREEGCEGLWFLKGLDENGNEKLVVFSADKHGKIINNECNDRGHESNEEGGAANYSTKFPPFHP